MASKQKLGEEEDKISNLPESILVQILSCLSTKDAVGTCVLSKTWCYLWRSITKLRFDNLELRSLQNKFKAGKKKCFADFVSRVLLHLTTSSIHSFSLNVVSNGYDSSLMNTWISAVLHRRVGKLMIYYHPTHSYSSLTILCSQSLFSCKSLVHLSLNMSCIVRLPAFVHLPNLKALELSKVHFRGDSSSDSKDVTLSFPVLKKFESNSCFWHDVQNVSLQVPLLETALLKFHSSPHVDEPICIIKFCASCHLEFSYEGTVSSQQYILSDPSLALNASAILDFRSKVDDRTCKLIRQFSHVKYLRLDSIEVSAEAKDTFANLPAFIMLRYLKLRFVKGDMLMELLPKTPNLTILEIEVLLKFDEELLDSAIVPNCLSDSLKEFKLTELTWSEDDLHLAKYVMENGLVLELLSFSSTCSSGISKTAFSVVAHSVIMLPQPPTEFPSHIA
ncbi:F-box/FBD/LRR-repeat protein [Senna tora]|uniref:F-box/FBD/LRR-repeat protein n=1 Tax=Senna tora TaxID=362788 RepID=A0A834TI06_9FABA|nr:F-box/FBD/LRR-repeat protein [Senna tora]